MQFIPGNMVDWRTQEITTTLGKCLSIQLLQSLTSITSNQNIRKATTLRHCRRNNQANTKWGEGGADLWKERNEKGKSSFSFFTAFSQGRCPCLCHVDWLKQKILKSHRTEWHHSTRKWGGKFQKIWGELQLCIINTDQILTWPLNHVCQRLKVRPPEPNWDLSCNLLCNVSRANCLLSLRAERLNRLEMSNTYTHL